MERKEERREENGKGAKERTGGGKEGIMCIC